MREMLKQVQHDSSGIAQAQGDPETNWMTDRGIAQAQGDAETNCMTVLYAQSHYCHPET